MVEEAEDQIELYSDLYTPIERQMRRQAYDNWQTAVNEHLIRAITVRLMARVLGPEDGQRALKTERQRGFLYIDALVDRLVEYEANRDRYPTFESFFPRLVSVFAELSEDQ